LITSLSVTLGLISNSDIDPLASGTLSVTVIGSGEAAGLSVLAAVKRLLAAPNTTGAVSDALEPIIGFVGVECAVTRQLERRGAGPIRDGAE
jgi:hypothetical protein